MIVYPLIACKCKRKCMRGIRKEWKGGVYISFLWIGDDLNRPRCDPSASTSRSTKVCIYTCDFGN